MSNPVHVIAEATPNPQSMRFRTPMKITDTPTDFKSANETLPSPLARKIFGFPWTEGVFIGQDFVTVTKQDWVDWETLAEPLAGLIAEHLERGEAVLHTHAANTVSSDDSPVIQQIKKILDEEIRPAVAMDGGDIVFHKYEDQTVFLYMQGSCSGCPSSTYTLKEGIEVRLKNAIPEIKEVVAM